MSKNFSCTAYDDYKLCILNKDSYKGIIYDIRHDLSPRLEASELLASPEKIHRKGLLSWPHTTISSIELDFTSQVV